MRVKSEIEQRIDEFEKRHGGREAAVRSLSGTYWLYPDGARRDDDPQGLLEEPPELNLHPYRGNEEAHSWEVLNRRIEYHEVKVARAESQFYEHHRSMGGVDYTSQQLQKLERLKVIVAATRKELNVVLAEQREHPYYQRQQAASQAKADREARIKEKNANLSKMRI